MKNVWVNGTFDILHIGHIELIKYASTLGDRLFIGIDSDARVKTLKGEDRPINDQTFRKTILESLIYVHKVSVFDTDYQLQELIKSVSPAHMVIGGDYLNKKIIGAEFCEKITFFPRLMDYSSTKTIEKIKKS